MFKTLLTAVALAAASLGAQAAWNTTGDVLVDGGTLTLTSAFKAAGDPDRFFNVSGTPAAEIPVLEAALGLPAYALDLSAEEYGTEGSVAWQSFSVAAGDTLSFSWTFTTRENDFEDHAFAVLGGQVLTLATRTQGGGSGAFSHVFTQGGTFTLGLGVIDTVDYLGVSTLQVSGLSVTPVPEPGTLAMWLAGIAGLGGLRLRRRASGAAR